MTVVVLSRALVLESPQNVADGAGGFAASWVALGTVWADVVARASRETAGDGGLRALSGYRITVRAAPVGASNRPRPGQQFRDGTRVFRILNVAEADRAARYLICLCQEELAP